MTKRVVLSYGLMILVLIGVGFFQSWNVAFGIFNLCLISAVMALGVNMQWGYAGLFNVGDHGLHRARRADRCPGLDAADTAGLGRGRRRSRRCRSCVSSQRWSRSWWPWRMVPRPLKIPATVGLVIAGYFLIGAFFLPATERIELIDPALSGYLGGLGTAGAAGMAAGRTRSPRARAG
ncbi:MAG: hypothetical protein ACMVO3_19280 [Thalassobaculum sp.]